MFKTMKLIAVLIFISLLITPVLASGEDSKEVLTLKRDLLQEQVLRVQIQLQLMERQYMEGKAFLQDKTKDLAEANKLLKAFEDLERAKEKK